MAHTERRWGGQQSVAIGAADLLEPAGLHHKLAESGSIDEHPLQELSTR
ncbi:hypothetical protein [Streptomyces goshikiensis]